MVLAEVTVEGADQEAAVPRPVAPPGRGRLRRAVPPVAMLVVVIGAWQLVSSSLATGRQFLLPPPWEVLTKGLVAHEAYSKILPALGRSTELAVVGLLIAMALGILIGSALYRFGWLERASFPWLVAIQAIPVLAIAPLIAVALGYTFVAKLVIVVIIAFFPIPTSLLLGLKSVDRGLVDLFSLHRAGWFTRFFKLALPNALPTMFTGFRISAGLAVIGAIVGEQQFQSGSPGLGMLLLQYIQYVEYDQVYGCIIVSSLLGIAMFMTFTWLSRRLFGSWHESVEHDRQMLRAPRARRAPRFSPRADPAITNGH
ncbi:MAG: ABC transporter permease [Acidimicrobiales bacterium]|nr:ABC transporter permease [Acidimicrobiales bacterium]MBO0893939.1 ABC transporter permease [Acidimicrobiales bacterium]